jgi:Zn-dependent protease with chaperone function
MFIATIMDSLRSWFSSENLPSTLGYVLAIVCGIFLLTELYSIITQKNEPDLAMILLAGVLGGVIQGVTTDVLLSILTVLCWIMIYSLWTIRESPVWRELMLASLVSYLFVLVGRALQVAIEMRTAYYERMFPGYEIEFNWLGLGLSGQQWFGISWNLFIYVFFLLCIIFFGRRFFLVSRLTSPQIIYLLLFALSYVILFQLSGQTGLKTIFYSGATAETASQLEIRLLFASFGTYEIMIITNLILYLISGPLLHGIFGVRLLKTTTPFKLINKIENRINRLEANDIQKKFSNFKQSAITNTPDKKLLKELDTIKKKIPEDNKRLVKQLDKLYEKIADKKEHERVLKLVEEVKQKLNIKGRILVGKVKAPILNAFAFGAFFDKRIAFMSKDIRDFSDDDIKGIAGHELAHASRLHTLWLMFITMATFMITKAIQLPATPLDYIFAEQGLDFLWYYLYNLGILAVSYIFVRFLEGRADKLTMEAGYGKPLAKSLVRLDGFYQGIASEMGLSVYLLTDKEQTKAEKIRFLGDSGRNMYNNYVKPSVGENLVNLIASHPKTAYRVVALTEQEKLRPFKAAMLPFLLSIPYVRRKYVKELQSIRKNVSPVIDETFSDSYPKTGVKTYDTLTHLSYQYNYLKGKQVVAISKIDKKEFILGEIKNITTSNDITSPIKFDLKTESETKTITTSDYDLHEFAIGQKQVFKNGKIGTIQEITSEGKFEFKAKLFENGSEIIKEMKIPGIPVDYFEEVVGKNILLMQKGITRLARLDAIEFNDNSIANSKFVLSVGDQTKTIGGDKFIIGFKPFDVYLKKGKEEQQYPILESLTGKPISFQTKDDLDTLTKGYLKEVTKEAITLEILDEDKEIKTDRLEFLYSYEDSLILYYKPSLSFIERTLMRLQNRKRLAHIIS